LIVPKTISLGGKREKVRKSLNNKRKGEILQWQSAGYDKKILCCWIKIIS